MIQILNTKFIHKRTQERFQLIISLIYFVSWSLQMFPVGGRMTGSCIARFYSKQVSKWQPAN